MSIVLLLRSPGLGRVCRHALPNGLLSIWQHPAPLSKVSLILQKRTHELHSPKLSFLFTFQLGFAREQTETETDFRFTQLSSLEPFRIYKFRSKYQEFPRDTLVGFSNMFCKGLDKYFRLHGPHTMSGTYSFLLLLASL